MNVNVRTIPAPPMCFNFAQRLMGLNATGVDAPGCCLDGEAGR